MFIAFSKIHIQSDKLIKWFNTKNNMRVIGLCGHGSCGKSATLNMLKELLRATGRSISSTPHPCCEAPETFEYKELIVCVAPGGDTREIVESNCRYFKEKNCDVAISATRSKWGPNDALRDFASNENAAIEWIQKSYEYNLCEATQTLCNQETASLILSKI